MTRRRCLPPRGALDGARLAAALKKRRDGLVAAALEFYARLASRVDVHATDLADSVRVTRGADGGLELSIASAPGASPWFDRRFDPRETREVRLYLYAGLMR